MDDMDAIKRRARVGRGRAQQNQEANSVTSKDSHVSVPGAQRVESLDARGDRKAQWVDQLDVEWPEPLDQSEGKRLRGAPRRPSLPTQLAMQAMASDSF